jgi:hypothetical protein
MVTSAMLQCSIATLHHHASVLRLANLGSALRIGNVCHEKEHLMMAKARTCDASA